MKSRYAFVLSLLAVVVVSAAVGAPPKKPPKKPAASAVGPAQPMPGQWAELGKLYYLDSDKHIAFSLKAASFACGRLYFGADVVAPSANEKMLVLEFTFQNAGKEEWTVNWATAGFTAVDSSDQNREGTGYVGQSRNKEKLDMRLKPAQKADCYTCLMLPNDCQAPKLMVIPYGEEKALRYDLHGKVKGLEAPYADPADKTGATGLSEIPAEKGKAYPGRLFDFGFDGISFAGGTYAGSEPNEGYGWAICAATITNRGKEKWTLNWATLTPTLSGRSGTIEFSGGTFADADGNGGFDTSLEPGKTASVQYCFPVKRGATLQSFALQEGEEEGGRRYVWDLGGVRAEFAATPAAEGE
jgi:hypothetical protein